MKLAKLVCAVTLCNWLIVVSTPPSNLIWAAATPEREELIAKLVEGTRKEGELTVFGVASMGDTGAKAIGGAFKTRFGLNNLRVKYVLEGAYGAVFGQGMMETQMRLPATFDVLNGPDDRVATLMEVGGSLPIDRWDVLLPDGVDPKLASPSAVAGHGFVFATRVKATIYNTKLIKGNELPQTTKDVGAPQHKGKFYISPWPTAAMYGILMYDKNEWLEIMRGWARNKAMTIRSEAGVQRIMLGEFTFEPFSNAYMYLKHKEKGDPVGLDVFKDVVPVSSVLHVVRKGARNPNAGKLFALWATGPEAVQIFERYSGVGNINLKESLIGASEMKEVKRKGARLLSWLDNTDHLKVFKWYSTKEGRDYEDKLAVALGIK